MQCPAMANALFSCAGRLRLCWAVCLGLHPLLCFTPFLSRLMDTYLTEEVVAVLYVSDDNL